MPERSQYIYCLLILTYIELAAFLFKINPCMFDVLLIQMNYLMVLDNLL